MKDENNGAIMAEFVGLRAKMYMVRVDGKNDTKKAKGMKNNVVARTITFDDYTRCLNEEIEITSRQSCTISMVYDLNYTRYTRYSNRKSESMMTNDTSYRTRPRHYHGGIGGYLCNICYYYVLFIVIFFHTFFSHLYKYY